MSVPSLSGLLFSITFPINYIVTIVVPTQVEENAR